MKQEKKLRLANTDSIAVFPLTAFDRNVVDKRAVQTFQICDYEALVRFLDERVTTGHRGVGYAHLGGPFAADYNLIFVNGEDGSFEFAGDSGESRLHVFECVRPSSARVYAHACFGAM